MKQVLQIFVFVFILFAFVAPSFAEEYSFESGTNNSIDNAFVIPNPNKSQYVYGYISKGADTIDYYVFEPTDFLSGVGISLLTVGSSTTFKPTLILADASSGRLFGKAPYNFPSNLGGRVLSWTDFTEMDVRDDDTFQKLVQGPTIVRDLTTQRYVLAVFDPNGIGGRYAIHIETSEKKDTGILATLRHLIAAFRIKTSFY